MILLNIKYFRQYDYKIVLSLLSTIIICIITFGFKHPTTTAKNRILDRGFRNKFNLTCFDQSFHILL